MGKRKMQKNAGKRRRWHNMLNDHWARQQKMNMKRLVGEDPNTVKPVTGTIDGRNWTSFFPAPMKYSGFSFLEFTRRMESIQDDYPERLDAELRAEVDEKAGQSAVARKMAARQAKGKIKQMNEVAQQRRDQFRKQPNNLQKLRVLKESRKAKRKTVLEVMSNPYRMQSSQVNDSDDEKW